MCGRYSLGVRRADLHRIQGWRHIQPVEWIDEENFQPRHNIAPHSNGVVIRRMSGGAGSSGGGDVSTYVLQTMQWGLIPNWCKHQDKTLNTTNARSESLIQGGRIWGPIKGKNRCVVVAEGYYEWQKRGSEKIPYFTRFRGGDSLLLMAGLYDIAHLDGDTHPTWTYTIVTTDANKDFAWLHDRQPVILSSEAAVNTWLDTSSPKWTSALESLLQPYHDESAPLECYRVPLEVGKVGTESPAFIKPLDEREDGIKAMFLKQPTAGSSCRAEKRKRSPQTTEDVGGDSASRVAASPDQPPEENVDLAGSNGNEGAQTTPKKPRVISVPKKGSSAKASPRKVLPRKFSKPASHSTPSPLPNGMRTLDQFFK